jgi:hypothetical protein
VSTYTCGLSWTPTNFRGLDARRHETVAHGPGDFAQTRQDKRRGRDSNPRMTFVINGFRDIPEVTDMQGFSLSFASTFARVHDAGRRIRSRRMCRADRAQPLCPSPSTGSVVVRFLRDDRFEVLDLAIAINAVQDLVDRAAGEAKLAR